MTPRKCESGFENARKKKKRMTELFQFSKGKKNNF